jgi:hypothetical protein
MFTMKHASPSLVRGPGRNVLLAVILLHASVALADLSAEEVIAAVGIPAADMPRLQQGEIVSFSISEGGAKSLASGIAMYVKASPARFLDLVKRGGLLAADPAVIARGDLAAGSGAEAFAGFSYTAAQADEARDLLEVTPGSDFNLSSHEIASFQDLQSRIDMSNDKAVVEAVSANYRTLLAERLKAYQQGGLKGIAAYDRGEDKKNDPGVELAADTQENNVLARFFPDLQQALLHSPATLPAGVESQFIWINREVQKRPTPILSHRLTYSLNNGAVMVQREFYVGHSYNSSQATFGSLPYQDGAIILYGLRSSTDQVAGVGQELKHSIGREQVKKEIIKHFQRIKAALRG